MVEQLLSRGVEVKAIVRSLDALADNPKLIGLEALASGQGY